MDLKPQPMLSHEASSKPQNGGPAQNPSAVEAAGPPGAATKGPQSASASAFDSSMPKAPSISLPKGGGAIRGMGEKFDVNLSNGTGTTSMPIACSKSNLQPDLTLSYNSGAGNGLFGIGWQLSLPRITRKTDKGLPRYDDGGSDPDSDVFLISDAEDLVPVFKRDQSGRVLLGSDETPIIDEFFQDGYSIRRYKPRIEGSFNRTERWTNLSDLSDVHWRTVDANNVTRIFGSNRLSRIADPNIGSSQPARIWSWLIAEVYDSQGNAMIYNYKPEDSSNVLLAQAHEANRSEATRSANRHLKSIQYCNSVPNRQLDTWNPFTAFNLAQDAWRFSIVFDYGEHDVSDPKPDDSGLWICRQDPFSDYRPGFEVRTYRLCSRILMFHHFPELDFLDYVVKSTEFTYDQNPTLSYLTSGTLSGYSWDSSNGAYFKQSLPPVEYEYSRFPTDTELSKLVVQEVGRESLENLPIGLDGTNYQWVDLYGEGLPGVLTDQGGAWYYAANSSPTNFMGGGDSGTPQARFDAQQVVGSKPSGLITHGYFGDVSGAGNVDLIQTDPGAWGYYEWTQSEGWASFKTFSSFANVEGKNKNMQFVDLSGDGLADILIYGDQVYTWYPSLGADGYGPGQTVTQPISEDLGPMCVYADSEQTIYLADMSGDGMTDIIRIRNGDICYWPNCGYGNFGQLVQMDNSPWFDESDIFDRRRIRLVDIDGSGTTDILYLGSHGVDMYLNQSGNSFEDKKHLDSFPQIDSAAVVSALDFLGSGTACIVWSSPLPTASPSPMRYVDILQGKKPHLITKVKNNLGTETKMQYAPSTRFYLRDKEDGNPWITRLPFPVQCVERTETVDKISGNVFTTRYSYHHGFFDGFEREFRGFGRVEKFDTEDFASISQSGATNVDSSWHSPPVRTKTWFHTGIYADGQNVSRQLAREYFGAPPSSSDNAWEEFYGNLLDDTIFPPEIQNVDQQREACRALKGRILRTEVYADDGSSKANIPYNVHETNFTIVPVQPLQDVHSHGVYFVHSRESLEFHFERKQEDPRIKHELVLEVDSFGNVLKHLDVAYGRLSGKSPLNRFDKDKQETPLIIYSESDFTNSVDAVAYRLPVEAESRQYELTGIKSPTSGRFKFDDLVADSFSAILQIPEIPYESVKNPLLPQKSLFRKSRKFYRKDNLTGILPLGRLESLALPGVAYELSFTPGLLASTYQSLISDPKSTLDQAGYVDLDQDSNWWKPSGRIFYTSDPSGNVADEISSARRGFFIPRRFVDPFENATTVTYDPYFMFPVLIVDKVGNSSSAVMNYRSLQPSEITSENGNRSVVAFDTMGYVAGTAIMGKATENVGDSLQNFQANLSDAQLDAFFTSPTIAAAAALLGESTTRVVYDLKRFWKSASATIPAYSAIISRESHVSDLSQSGNSRLQLKFTYSDGFGRSIQVKDYTTSGPLVENGPIVANRWIGSGWTVFDNKGNPVKRYEPFFDDTHDFKFNMVVGVSPTLMYDPVGRVVATLRADHTFEKVVFDAWTQTSHDVNDNALLSNPTEDVDVGQYFALLPKSEYLPSWYDARITGAMGVDERVTATKTAAHANTPHVAYFDPLGRTVLSVDNNGNGEKFLQRTEFDIQNNQRSIIDAVNRTIMRYDYSLSSEEVHHKSMEAGEEWVLRDALGRAYFKWNNRGFQFRSVMDPSDRLLESWISDDRSSEILVVQNVYGEVSPDAEDHNRRGKLWQTRDQSGLTTMNDFDFKGNLVNSELRLAKSYKDTFDISKNFDLEDESYVSTAAYDALNRSVQTTAPDSSVTYRLFNQTGHLDKTFVNVRSEISNTDPTTWSPTIQGIDYNEKGQIQTIRYGNGSITTQTYDRLTFRLQKIRTVAAGSAVQDLTYTHDPTGNIAHIKDAAQQSTWFRNNRADPSSDYTYDATYRLVSATGREHLGQSGGRPNAPTAPGSSDGENVSIDSPSDGNAMGTYTESYKYDAVGNILSVSHAGSDAKNPGWTRRYLYNETSQLETGKVSNRLTATVIGSTTEYYKYDEDAGLRGNISSMSSLPMIQWDYNDQLRATSKQIVSNGGTTSTTYYVYNSSGERVRKVTERAAEPGSTPTKLKEQIYMTGFESFKMYNGSGAEIVLERTTLPVKNDVANSAYIETRTQGTDDGAQRLLRYQLSNVQGSSCVELDDQARIISYEEYFPYGSTSYQGVASQLQAPKRYRYSGKEKDNENGLYFYGARYYASWLGRWISCDPTGVNDGPNLYQFVRGNPTTFTDPDGRQAAPVLEPPPPPEAIPNLVPKSAPRFVPRLVPNLPGPEVGPTQLPKLAPELPALLRWAGPVTAFLAVMLWSSPLNEGEDEMIRQDRARDAQKAADAKKAADAQTGTAVPKELPKEEPTEPQAGGKPGPKPQGKPDQDAKPYAKPDPAKKKDKDEEDDKEYVVDFGTQGADIKDKSGFRVTIRHDKTTAQKGPITVAEGKAALKALRGMLSESQLEWRKEYFAEAEAFIEGLPKVGGIGPVGNVSFPKKHINKQLNKQDKKRPQDTRVDIEFRKGHNFRS